MMEMNSYSGKRIYPKNCRMNGCFDWAMYGRKACVGCGHDKAEHDRRMKLPLRKDADGLLRIHVEEEAAEGTA